MHVSEKPRVDEGSAVEGEAPMKPNPNHYSNVDNALAILRGVIDPQDAQIDQWLAQHSRGQEHKVEPIKEDDDGTNQNN